MPTTSTAKNARDCTLRLDDDTGTLINISTSSNEVTIKRERQIGEYNAFGDPETYVLEGNRNASLDVTMIFSKGASEAIRLLRLWDQLGGYRTFQFDIPGTPIDRYSAEVLLESWEIPAKQDEAKPIMVKCAMKVHGALDWSEV